MDILFTGRLSQMTNELCEQLLVNHKLTAAAEDVPQERLNKKITPFRISPNDDDFEKIFNSYNYDTVIFISQPVFAGKPYFDEFRDLERCLKICDKHDVNRFLYICTDYSFKNKNDDETDLSVLFNSCNELCDFYRQRKSISVVTMRIPCLYAKGESSSLIGASVNSAKTFGAVSFDGAKKQTVGFLSQEDLGELLLRIVESWPQKLLSFSVPASNTMTFEELGALLHNLFATCRLSYSNVLTASPAIEIKDSVPKKEFDWIPIRDLNEDIVDIVKSDDNAYNGEKPTVFSRIKDFLAEHSFIIKLAEVIIGFILMEFLSRVTSNTAQFRYIDFRLLYVVILGTAHGLNIGLISAALACVSLAAASIMSATNWSATIYDINTWLPFIFFFIAGSVTGYIKDKLYNENKNLSEEKAILEEKFVLLNEFYASALSNKDRYKNQIMSYRDSFGRLFDITKNLDSTLVDQVFREALEALEGILDNKSICIYNCNAGVGFARLIICSKEIISITDKSLNFAKYDQMVSHFEEENVWVNRDRLIGYPEYAMPIYHNEELIALVTVQKTKYDQMSIYYENLIKIVCGLIKISLVRAIEFTKQIEDDIYIQGSRIMKPEYFSRVISVKESMQESGNSEYILIRFDVSKDNIVSVGNQLSQSIRTTDVIGVGTDGHLYICLNQTSKKDIQIVLSRIQKAGIRFNTLNSGEANEHS